MALLNRLIVIGLVVFHLQLSTQYAVKRVPVHEPVFDSMLKKRPIYDTKLLRLPVYYDSKLTKRSMSQLSFASQAKEIFNAVRRGVDYDLLWYELKTNPVEYLNSAVSMAFMGGYSARKLGYAGGAAGAGLGATLGIYGHYVIAHNFQVPQEAPDRPYTNQAKLYLKEPALVETRKKHLA